ncbi:Transcriptional regulator, LysR family [Roseibacterium elongatum DSM 19469]|uniref:Transcriptional regulator, LysR family n=1 Tax=Roseicyclus elongatus DSM 19469 TaxID=1294273 RepID=W8RR62_9RHOB|nr:LysR family transcriptional regulator [Roseibacterium elongatum]AHM03674.1 Transcriptional regulator, LysR family [Roseibacterium elongatum DSM 19469]
MRPDTRSAHRVLRDLDWNLLHTFVVLAQSRSITDGARKLRLQQPSVSSALKRLEDQIGRRLIDRAPGRFDLTEAGELLYAEALDIQGAVLRLATVLRETTDEVRGHVRMTVASHVVCPLLDSALAEFHAAHPSATCQIDVMTSSDAIAAVEARAASFAICLVRAKNPKLEYRRLYREFFGLFCGPPHPLFGRRDLTRADLKGLASVSFQTDRLQDVLKPVALMRAASDLEDHIVGTSSHLEEVRRMIIAGLGVGPLPLHVAARDVAAGEIWQVPPYDDLPAIDVHLVWNPRSKLNRAEQIMLEDLKTRIETTPIERRTYR